MGRDAIALLLCWAKETAAKVCKLVRRGHRQPFKICANTSNAVSYLTVVLIYVFLHLAVLRPNAHIFGLSSLASD